MALASAGGLNAFGQKTVRLSSTPSDCRTFFKKFAVAVNKGHVQQIASMTGFPFNYGFDTGDEGSWNKKQFVANAGRFLKPNSSVFKDPNPEFTVAKGTYTLTDDSDASYYTFMKKGGVYRFISFVVEP